MKQYVGISKDHSGSMRPLSVPATKDYNDNISALKTASEKEGIDTIVNVVSFGILSQVRREIVNSSVTVLKPLLASSFVSGGQTPLLDSVSELIDLLRAAPDADDKDVSFLVMVITDGQENASRIQPRVLADRIKELQATDRWTFTFRVPRGGRYALTALGIPNGNIQEWEQTELGFNESTAHTNVAIGNFYTVRAAGVGSSTSFYTNPGKISPNKIKSTLTDISSSVKEYPVTKREEIQSLMTKLLNRPYMPGSAFYQLTKTEKAVQSYKGIIIRNRNNGIMYAGDSARTLLGLPTTGTIKLAPGDHGDWDIFIQSVSNNRILYPGTSVLYWPNSIM